MDRLLLIAVLTCAIAAHAESYDEMVSNSRADCRKAAAQYPAQHRPDVGEASALRDCDAAGFYYGIGRPVDDLKARHCAFANGDDGVLLMLYANGRGVPRDFSLARRAACNMDAAPAEMSARLLHLDRMEKGMLVRHPPAPLDICDDITSGLMMGVCANLTARRAAAKRETGLAHVVQGWPPAQQAAWKRLRDKAETFAQTRGTREVDRSGTARAAMEIEAAEEVRDSLVSLLREAEAGKLDHALAAGAGPSDLELNEVYRKIRELPDPEHGTVNMAGIRDAQRAWLDFRDAWIAFARTRYPALATDVVRARLTNERLRMLKDLLDQRTP